MRRFRILTLIAVLGASRFLPAQSPPAPAAARDDKAELKQLENEWMRTVREQDLPALDRILAPDFAFTVAVAGKPLSTITRDAYLRRAKEYIIRESRFDEILVRTYGNVAVVLSRYSHKAALHGRDRSAEFLLTDTWVKLDGQWLAAARVSSRPEHSSP
ncbi:MAG: nuclear transport factor 2 family protein [Thermoanaerobaculia bacterium]